MTKIYLTVTGASASAEKIGPLTTGMVGAQVECSFSQEWEDLNRLMVFRAGEVKKDNSLQDGKSFVPAEVLTQPGQMLYIGVEGRSKDGTVVIPTVWAEAGKILSGAYASGDPALAPTPSQFERFMAEVEQVDEKIEAAMTQAKESGEFAGEKGEKGDKDDKGDKGDKGDQGDKGDIGEAFTYEDFTEWQLAALKGEKGDTPYVFTTTYTAKASDIGSTHYVPISTIDESKKTVEMGDLLISNEGNLYRALSANLTGATLIRSELLAVLKGNAGSVTSVNGVAPDENGNVQIETSSQSDWNAAEGEPGHVLNRTHWVEGGMVEIPVAGEWVEESGQAGVYVNAPIGLEAGKTYTVAWNGTKYETIGLDLNEISGGEMQGVFLGNLAIMGGEDNGLPFCMVEYPAETAAEVGFYGVIAGTDYVEVPFSIYGEGKIVHKLDPKYLPEGVPYVEQGEMVEILPECQPPYDESEGAFIHKATINVEVGTTYVVNWNGTEYECVAVEGGQMGVCLGDLTALGGSSGNGEPFCICCWEGMVVALPIDESAELTLSIYQKSTETIHKLDNKFLDLPWLPTVKKTDTMVMESATTASGTNVFKYSVLPLGTNVAVMFDGVRYECVVKRFEEDGDGVHYFGNLAAAFPVGTNTGEPFCFYTFYESSYYFSVFADGNEHMVAVYKVDTQYNVIPDGFLGDKKVSTIALSTLGMTTIETDTTETITTDTSAIIKTLDEGGRVPLAFKLELSNGSGGTTEESFTAMLDGTKNNNGYQWSGLHNEENWGLYAVIVEVADTTISVTNRKIQ